MLKWTLKVKEDLQDQDIIINLAGENIGAKRWSTSQKQKIINSRVDATRIIADLCAQLGTRSPRILNASAIGVYGFSNNAIFTENSALKNPECFLELVGNAWEQALLTAENANISIVKMRFGVISSNANRG